MPSNEYLFFFFLFPSLNIQVTELLLESRTALLVPVFSKPLRAQPLYVQIGHIEALTYCLGLRYNSSFDLLVFLFCYLSSYDHSYFPLDLRCSSFLKSCYDI